MFNREWPAFLKWAERSVALGDYVAADWLAEAYETGEDNVIHKDLVRAYMWYDIAAEIHAHKIRQMPSSSSPLRAEDNKQEINYRDAVAEQLTRVQVDEALRLEKRWFEDHISQDGNVNN